MDWFAWLGKFVKMFGDLIPQRIKVAPTHRVVLFRGMQRMIVRREGRYWYWPWISSVVELPVKRQVISLTAQYVTTRDGIPVQTDAMVTYEIGDTDEEILLAAVQVFQVEASIDDEASAVLCGLLTTSTYDEIQQDRRRFNARFTSRARTRLREYGLRVKRAQMTTFVTGIPLLHFVQPSYTTSPS